MRFMKIKHYILALPLIAALSLFADKKLTVRNADTEESFEVTVPDGMTVREYNPDWLDSVPYLTEHARWHEPWAYEALAECWRYGKGGVEKSLFAACMYYEAAGITIDDIIEKSSNDDTGSQDDFSSLINLINLFNRQGANMQSVVDSLPRPLPKWALMVKEAYRLDAERRKDFIESKLTPDASTDEFVIGVAMLGKLDVDVYERFAGISDENRRQIKMWGDRMPFLYDDMGGKLWINYYDQSDAEEDRRDLALEYMYMADQAGLLSKCNMTRILTYWEEHGRGDKFPFSDEDLSRFDQLCPKEYRDAFNSPAVVEEEVVAEEEMQ